MGGNSVISEKLGPFTPFFAPSAMEGSARNDGVSVAGSATSATALARSWKVVCAEAFAGAETAFGAGSTETTLALSHPAAAAAALAGALLWGLAGDEATASDTAGRAIVCALTTGSAGSGAATGAALAAAGTLSPWTGFADFLASALV